MKPPGHSAAYEGLAMDGGLKPKPPTNYQPPKPQSFKAGSKATATSSAKPATSKDA